MIDLKPLLAQAKATGDWQPLADAIPFARYLGIAVAVTGDEIVCTMRFDPKLIGNYTIPALHGGTLGGLLESTAVFALLFASETVMLPKIINVTIDYQRSARAVDTHAVGVITKAGRRVTTVQAAAWQDDRKRPVATANAHFLIQAQEL